MRPLAVVRDHDLPLRLPARCGGGFCDRSVVCEALRAFWRVYWPVQLFAIAGYVPFLLWIRVAGRYFILRSSALPVEGLVLAQFVLSGVGLFLFVPRIASQPYQRFSIQVIDPDGNPTRKLSLRHRAHLWFFLWLEAVACRRARRCPRGAAKRASYLDRITSFTRLECWLGGVHIGNGSCCGTDPDEGAHRQSISRLSARGKPGAGSRSYAVVVPDGCTTAAWRSLANSRRAMEAQLLAGSSFKYADQWPAAFIG